MILADASALHSFIIEDVADIIALFTSVEDQATLRTVIEERPKEQLATLSPSEAAFLYLYDVSPGDIKGLLKSCWGNMGSALSDLPDEGFHSLMHDCIGHTLRVYVNTARGE
ncbi:MAG: hypothetical protein J3Q66DRAFT_374838 [Benniella sp.]|nr:MAG: hypothetical protein J3Q66DRAFT_374838 [Benniella sp.]